MRAFSFSKPLQIWHGDTSGNDLSKRALIRGWIAQEWLSGNWFFFFFFFDNRFPGLPFPAPWEIAASLPVNTQGRYLDTASHEPAVPQAKRFPRHRLISRYSCYCSSNPSQDQTARTTPARLHTYSSVYSWFFQITAVSKSYEYEWGHFPSLFLPHSPHEQQSSTWLPIPWFSVPQGYYST